MDLKELCIKVREIVKETGLFILEERKNFSMSKDVEIKGHSNYVTYIDKASEERLVRELGELIPGSGFIAEEGTSEKKGEVYNWVIDPIDGTTNFIHGLSPFSISVGLMRNKEVVLGVVYEISHGEMFYAWEGSEAYLNGEIIKVSVNSEHQQALIVTGFPYCNFKHLDSYFATMREVMEKASGIRRLGSAAIDLCYVACGRFEAFWEYALNPWDVAAGSFIVKQAGGKVSDFSGGDRYLFGGEIIASNSNYFDKFYEIVYKNLKK
ncbi:MAG: inositol monophosphatase [Prolixibacteraceae bacterium]|nr:inositol monophosphatase [Prolixibacteraceae bacterium]